MCTFKALLFILLTFAHVSAGITLILWLFNDSRRNVFFQWFRESTFPSNASLAQ